MKIWKAALLTFSISVFASGCNKACDREDGCLEPDQCFDSPTLTRYSLPSRSYVVAQSSVGIDQCQLGRRSGDWNGLTVDVTANESTLELAMRVANGVDLGSGRRNPQPYCNEGSLAIGGVAGMSGATCTFSIALSTQVRLTQSDELYLSITETHSNHSAACPSVGTNGVCVIVYDLTLH